MRNYLCVLLVALLGLSFSGCARKPTPVMEPPTPAASVEKLAPVEPAAVETPAVATLTTPAGSLLETVHFAYDSSLLQVPARQALQNNAAWLQTHPTVAVTIEGHCDERGSGEYNLALGEQRARAVKTYLVDLGVAAERLQTISYGEEAPLDPNHNEAAWEKNRRAAFN